MTLDDLDLIYSSSSEKTNERTAGYCLTCVSTPDLVFENERSVPTLFLHFVFADCTDCSIVLTKANLGEISS
jgi:hypothetical protein